MIEYIARDRQLSGELEGSRDRLVVADCGLSRPTDRNRPEADGRLPGKPPFKVRLTANQGCTGRAARPIPVFARCRGDRRGIE